MTGRARKSLGQNFLVDSNLQRKTVAELEASEDDVVLEVGPGHGELTEHVLGTVHHLTVIEKDRDLAAELGERWGSRSDVSVVEGDALEVDLSSAHRDGRDLRVLSNVPYNVTSPLIFAFLDIRPIARRIVLTVQREVADRVVAGPGSKTYGALSVGVQAIARAWLAFPVGRQAFRPVPRVESAVITIEPVPEKIETIEVDRLRVVTRALFGQRRKQIQKILRNSADLAFEEDTEALLRRLDIDPKARPETLEPSRFVEIARRLSRGRGLSAAE